MAIYIQNDKKYRKDHEHIEMPCLHSFTTTNLGESILIFGGVNEHKDFSNKLYEFTLKDQSWKEILTLND